MTYTDRLLNMIKEGSSSYTVVSCAKKQLLNAGFKELKMENDWGLDYGQKYFVDYNGSSIFAFTINPDFNFRESFRIATAHTDSPNIRIKPNPDITTDKYSQINVECYGSMILNTWLDRPLSLAGRVALKSDDAFKPEMRIIDIKEPIATIPNLAIHMNREVNKGVELNKQTKLLPIAGMTDKELSGKDFINYLADYLKVSPEDILDFELNLYPVEEPMVMGINKEFISAPRLDNLTSCQALLTGIIEGERKEGINVIALFDHEEIGSHTKQGAGSAILPFILEKIMHALGRDRAKYLSSISDGFMVSVDVAHALHPNYTDKADVTNKPVLNGGICIKEACMQSYASDSEAIAIVQQICMKADIPYQKYLNRSDIAGGRTIGAIAGSMLPMKIADIGVPILAMHSAREMMGKEDQNSMERFMKEYFS